MAFGKMHHYLNISNCLSVKIPVRTKAYIYYNSVVPSAPWQRIKWVFTYDKMELLKWKVYGGKTQLLTWTEFELYFKILFWPWPRAEAGICYHFLLANYYLCEKCLLVQKKYYHCFQVNQAKLKISVRRNSVMEVIME